MPIRYSLRDNRLTPDPDDRYAQVESSRTASLDDVVDEITKRGTAIGRGDVASVLDTFQDVLVDFLTGGSNVSVPFANYSVSIQGVFTSEADAFDPSRHAVLPRVQAGAALRRAFRNGVPVERVEPSAQTPSLRSYYDHLAKERDSALTPGGVGEVEGARLAFDAEDEAQGVFFLAEDGTATRAETVPINKPSQLMVVVPAGLAPGAYRLEVRAAFGDEVREGRLLSVLTVA